MFTQEQLSGLKRYLRINAPDIESRGGIRQSRRIEGQFSSGSELKAYRAAMCYIQQGLENKKEMIVPIIRTIASVQQSQGRLDYHYCLFSFHSNKPKLQHQGSSLKVTSNANCTNLSKLLCDLAGDSPIDTHPAFINFSPCPNYIA
ncbi:MAG: hypothetical protein ACD_79C01283G0008 [uncultured bacterium]|nr:MAG: hypothetical protein ACD_79C01283G0008 [uncultured bacterium]